MSRTSVLEDGIILNNRYRIVKQLNKGSWGKTYLAEDRQRYRELFVLKEFTLPMEAPVQKGLLGSLPLENSLEAGLLKINKLQNSRITQFESLLKTWVAGQRRCFIVRDYVAGINYEEVLRLGGIFSEQDVVQWLREMLSILEVVHNAELVHGGISLQSVIQHKYDLKPCLVGLENSVINNLSSCSHLSNICTVLPCYAPGEQLQRGQLSSSGDIYSLAVTCLALLARKHPQELFDYRQKSWNWSQIVGISSNFAGVLRQMLAERPCDRPQNVEEVLRMLAVTKTSWLKVIFPCKSLTVFRRQVMAGFFSQNVFQKNSQQIVPAQQVSSVSQDRFLFRKIKPWQLGMFFASLIVVSGLVGFFLIDYQITKSAYHDSEENKDDKISVFQEQVQQQKLSQRVEQLKLDLDDFYRRVDYIFYRKHPELAGQQLNQRLEHQEYRLAWYKIASELLNQQEGSR